MRYLVLAAVLVLALACRDSTAPDEITCNNPIPEPPPSVRLTHKLGGDTLTVLDRYIVPRRWADTVYVFATANGNPAFDGLAAQGGARVILPHGGKCTLLSDSLGLYGEYRIVGR